MDWGAVAGSHSIAEVSLAMYPRCELDKPEITATWSLEVVSNVVRHFRR